MRKTLLPLLFALLAISSSWAQTKPTGISGKTAGMQKFNGYFPYYWDEATGRILLEINKLDQHFLYVNSLAAGLGSNDIGLDRGQLGGEHVVYFHKVGPKVLLIEPNQAYRAMNGNPAEEQAVAQSFAQSALWGFKVEATEGDKVLVDATEFLLRDAHDVVGSIRRSRQGSYRLDAGRSVMYLPRTKNFPQNSEFEATLTFVGGEDAGGLVRSVTPSAQAITVRQHHSFVQLPDQNYTPRPMDPRSGYFGIEYMDFSTPVDQPVVKRFIARHRLQKKNPAAAVSEAVEPIVYYVDHAAPEPIRTALLEGARWWAQAFEAAGYKDAFKVEILPADADPMDVRYNVIQWVHRSTRGWSYGASVTDPRTGEIIKGHVSLGSLRVRQDFLIAEGLLAPYEAGKPANPEMMKMALSRLRQLSAHELGHTLGIMHNYAASVSNRASVMDYPHPTVKLAASGEIDLSDAYAVGIGEWDKLAVTYGYQDFPKGTDEKQALDQLLRGGHQRGLQFISDRDSRAPGGAHPQAHLWDNGPNAADELTQVLAIREKALERFGVNNIKLGVPMAMLEDVLVPIYNYHRYQVEAAAKVVGGLNYTYASRGDGQIVTEFVPEAEQQKALDALLATLQPNVLVLPEKIIAAIPPRPAGWSPTRELFDKRTGLTFDPLAAAEASADFTLSFLFHPERSARLVELKARGGKLGLDEVMDQVLQKTWDTKSAAGLEKQIQLLTQQLVLTHLLALSQNEEAAYPARAAALLHLNQLEKQAKKLAKASDEGVKANALLALDRMKKPVEAKPQLHKDLPPGAPIGSGVVIGCE
ncbi:zinc-dependent metalloprotease [Rufibacter sediminis]|uniref:Zinc-dependent metalloprotease n=1 Tax=Rufibacter sediminis TaxID=2762756 RepID=A0ABR6VZD4_9BACT|nr:zinc-dependent metalloprotease [Rufibacter sediminis]MBC3541956.1 zinc-dependent metalloprotease [Rufibacter sediminis]